MVELRREEAADGENAHELNHFSISRAASFRAPRFNFKMKRGR